MEQTEFKGDTSVEICNNFFFEFDDNFDLSRVKRRVGKRLDKTVR